MNKPINDNRKQFTWKEFDFSGNMPNNWQKEIISFAMENAVSRTIIPTSVTSREASVSIQIPVLTVGGKTIKTKLPWLYDLYEGEFRDIGQTCVAEPLSVAEDARYAINLNVQRGTEMRYECHIDSNPLEGLLYVTSHPKGSGGELVVSNRPSAIGVEEISEDCEIIYPESGKLIFFDAREHPHYVAGLKDDLAIRVAVTMNFYTSSCPESARPKDLNKHLFGSE